MMRNGEGYADPTAYAALTNIMKENGFVYICSPYLGNPRVNVMRARGYCKFAVGKGKIPIAPHLYFPQFMPEATERDAAMRMNFKLMEICGDLWVFGSDISEGMAAEIAEAKRQGKIVRRFTTKCEEATT